MKVRRRDYRICANMPAVIGGRYGLGSHEFTPAMVKAVFDEIERSRTPNSISRVGINDDVTRLSLPVCRRFRNRAG